MSVIKQPPVTHKIFMSAEPRHFGPSEEDSREINRPDDIMKAIALKLV